MLSQDSCRTVRERMIWSAACKIFGALFWYPGGIKTGRTAEPNLECNPLQNSAPSSPKDSQQRSATYAASTSRRLREVVSASAKVAAVV
jgi:hypothetical protein